MWAPFLKQKKFEKKESDKTGIPLDFRPQIHTFFPKQRLEPVKDFVDDREHCVLGPETLSVLL